MIKGVKTIAQFKIAKWVEENFISGSVEITFTSDNSAIITDAVGHVLEVTYDDHEGIKYE